MKITKLYPPKNNGFVQNDLPFRSMTLFGALANCYITLFGKENFSEFLSFFEKGKIGSIFPAVKIDDKEIFFLPKPYLPKLKSANDDADSISKKKIKKIRWLSLSATNYLGNSIEQRGNEFFHTVDFIKDFTLIGKEFLVMKDELPLDISEKLQDISFYQKFNTVRVNVARFGEDSKPFDQSEINLIEQTVKIGKDKEIEVKTFLYFPEDIKEDKKWNATKLLFADEGIGGKRNLGKGWFKGIETTEINLNHKENSNLYMLISNLIPTKQELKNILSYEIATDDGYITYGFASPYKKEKLFYLKEGALINSKISGKIVFEKFKDKIFYRYGKAFLIPL